MALLAFDARQFGSWLFSALAILVILEVGQPLLSPLAFAVLIWAILNALTKALERLRLPSALAWTSSLLLVTAALYLFVRILANEAGAVADQAPHYFVRLQRFTASVLALLHVGSGANLGDLFGASNVAGFVARMVASAGSFLFTFALVIIFVCFLLAEQRHLPGKLARLQQDQSRRDETVELIHAAARQVQSYLGVCTLLSAIMGGATYLLLLAMHVSFASFWALVLFLATYIPTVGAAAVLLPASMALVQFGSFGPFLIIAAVLGALHFVLANIVSTLLLGRTLDLSPLGIILSLTFWGLLWGIGGLFLAVPITGAVVILCRHLRSLNWLAILLGGPEPKRTHKSRSPAAEESLREGAQP